MDIALLAEGTYPYHPGGVSVWCDQLVRGLAPHRFAVHAIVARPGETPVWEIPDNVVGIHSVPLWGPTPRVARKVRNSSELQSAFRQLAVSMFEEGGEDDFLDALHLLFALARQTPVAGALRSKASMEVLLEVMDSGPDDRTSTTDPVPVTVSDAKLALELIEHQLRPLFVPPPEADLCHATANGLAILLALGAKWSRDTPLVLSEHGIYLRERYLSYGHETHSTPLRSIMLRFFQRLTWAGYQIASAIAPGSEYNRQWQETNGAAPDRINPIYNGVDPDDFKVSLSEPDVPTLVWLGRIDPLKDVETLIRSFAKVHEVLPTARLRIFGGASPGNQEYLDRCIALRDSLGLVDSAIFEGRAPSVLEAFHAGHIVLLTSISEGFPYSLIEAMASGMPTVATDVGGVREATGDAGLVVPPKNPEETAAACLRLLSDADLRHTMGHAARARILSLFTLEQSLAIFGDLYREVTGRIASAHVLKHEQDLRRAGQGARPPHRERSIRRTDLPTVSRAGPVLLGSGVPSRCGP
jgi:glycosyltransferase involved in cell wall biosynthesis